MPIGSAIEKKENEKKFATGDWAKGFIQSTLSSPLELFGLQPLPEVEKFRDAHKWSGLASEFAGTAVPYVGWAKVATKIKPLAKAVGALEANAATMPIRTRAAQEIVTFAPFEAARAGISIANGQDPGEEAMQSIGNLALGGVVGGAIGAFSSAGKLAVDKNLAAIFPGIEVNQPLVFKIRQARDMIKAGGLPDEALAQNRLATMERQARLEIPDFQDAHVSGLKSTDGVDISRQVDMQFFRPSLIEKGNTPELAIRPFAHLPKHGFVDEATWRGHEQIAGLPEGWVGEGQYFRFITASTESKAKTLRDTASKLTDVGNGFRIGKEADGNYVVLKDLGPEKGLVRTYEDPVQGLRQEAMKKNGWLNPSGDLRTWYNAEAETPGRWLAFKTDKPSYFSQEMKTWEDLDKRFESWLPKERVDFEEGGDVLKALATRERHLPYADYTELQNTGKLGEGLRGLMGPLGDNVAKGVNHYLTPTMNQFAKSKLASYIWGLGKDALDGADILSNQLFSGAAKETSGGGLMKAIFFGPKAEQGGVDALLQKLTPKDVQDYYKIRGKSDAAREELYRAGAISPETHEAFNAVEAMFAKVIESGNATRKVFGGGEVKLAAGYGGIPHAWTGSLKQGITHKETGELIAVASADNARALELRVKKILEELGKEGEVNLTSGKIWNSAGNSPAPRDLQVWRESPFYAKESQNVRGWDHDFGEAGNLETLRTTIFRGLTSRLKDEAMTAFKGLSEQKLIQLAEIDPSLSRTLEKRISMLNGVEGPVTKAINDFVDPITSPILGKGGASKVVNAINGAFWHLQLGMGNVGHPINNMIGIFQTIIPEIAYVMGGHPERLNNLYTAQIVKGSRGFGVMSFLDPVKLMAAGIKETFKPEPGNFEFINRALRENVLDPKYLEEFGDQAAGRLSLKRLMKEGTPGAWVEAAKELSSFLPSASERFSRAIAFNTALKAGRDLLKLEGDALYGFAKKFTSRTMYSYSMSDRSLVLTSPAGMLFGSMKNWVSHYLANVFEYAGEAGRGNIAPLAWQMATTGLIGGVAAVPLLQPLAAGYAKAVEGENLLDWVYGGVNQRAGDAIMMGLPAVMGSSFSSATSNPIRDANMLFTFAHEERVKALGRSIGASIDNWQATGEHPASSEIARGAMARAVMPKAFYRGLQVYDNPGLKSLTTGYPIIDEPLGPWNKVLYTMGLQPAEIERGYLQFDTLMHEKEARQAAISRYGTALAEALTSQDTRLYDKVISGVLADGVDISSVTRSAMSRLDKADKGMLERNFGEAQMSAKMIGER